MDINGQEATIAGSTWSASVDVGYSYTTFEITATDQLGNQTTETFTVGVDIGNPVVGLIPPTSIGPEYIFPNGEVYVGSWHTDVTATSPQRVFYVPHERISAGSDLSDPFSFANVNLLNGNDIPYFDISIGDPPGRDSSGNVLPSSEVEDLELDMHYELHKANGDIEVKVRNRVIKEKGTTISLFLFPLVEEALGEGWHLAAPEDKHVVTFTVTDGVGRESTAQLKFRTQHVADVE